MDTNHAITCTTTGYRLTTDMACLFFPATQSERVQPTRACPASNSLHGTTTRAFRHTGIVRLRAGHQPRDVSSFRLTAWTHHAGVPPHGRHSVAPGPATSAEDHCWSSKPLRDHCIVPPAARASGHTGEHHSCASSNSLRLLSHIWPSGLANHSAAPAFITESARFFAAVSARYWKSGRPRTCPSRTTSDRASVTAWLARV